ncbi:MAG TPA: VCBS repeat-containing protein [Chitinophagaceae bacterium]|nr:VCBS repeat-containing protein [Chitinophagaceae bacterium]
MRILSLCFIIFVVSCSSQNTLFEKQESSQTGIEFNNTIQQTDSINIIEQENVYNGGGIAAGDFNNDGLQDLFFTGNLVPSKLYLNKGKLSFKDVTETAGINTSARWSRGVATVDINNDGKLDLYVCATLKKRKQDRVNMLFVNQGNNADGVPLFKEMAAEYGLADSSQTTMAAFFDYDNDGDLDCYLANNEIVDGDYPNRFRPILKDGSHANTDKLYRNDWNEQVKHGVFTDVSKEAGILWEGYAHGLNICDINRDGWKDIYVSNDYLSGNLLYINNRNGTFTNKVYDYFKHSSANAMGNDVIDINNDGLADLVELDMNPEDNYRKKMMMNPNSYQTYQNTDYFGYPYQYVRNSLQINLGNTVKANDSVGDPVFAETAYFSGIAQTDWSWTPSVADFDNDGKRDILISNGFPKDITDHDFVAYRNEAYMVASKQQLLDQIPEVKITNYAYRNKGNAEFENVSAAWGFTTPSFTNGAIYADLDNDGDLDYVTNNINDKAFVYRNTINDKKETSADFIQVKLKGDSKNINGLGAWVEVYQNKQVQVYENFPYRGYLSSVDPIIHFGLGKSATVDSLVVKWPGGKKQVIVKPAVNKVHEVSIANAGGRYEMGNALLDTVSYFREISGLINYKQEEKDFVDFNIQKLLPHKMSQYGPALAAGDINGDGLDDVMIGGQKLTSPVAMIQKADGSFDKRKLLSESEEIYKGTEDMGLLLFDADGDNDLDLYVASGTYESLPNTNAHHDCFYYNDGKGNFKLDTTVFPQNYTSKSCVKAADFDNDGDLDLFLGGRVLPGSYPKPVSSFIYRNDSKDGKVKFTDVTATVAKGLADIGLVCDAIWTDFDNDGLKDLVLTGEWMPVSFFKNEKGSFKNVTGTTGIGGHVGMWNSITGGDFDNDGDIDYVAGNLGLNSFYKGNEKEPLTIYAKDFDKNGSYDAFPTVFIPDVANGTRKEFPAFTRDDVIKQIIGFRQKFPGYKPFAQATIKEMFTAEEMKDALVLKANYMQSAFIRNDGGGKFTITPLPALAQWSAINGMVADDVDGDGNLDLVASTNDFGTEVTVGRYDALNGIVLKGDGSGNFRPASIQESGIFLPHDGKAMIRIMSAKGNYLLIASQNKGEVKCWANRGMTSLSRLSNSDDVAMISLKNGKQRKQEIYYGDSFLSQSSRFLNWNPNITKIEITDQKKQKRILQP